MAVSALVLPTVRLVGFAVKVMADGEPGANTTEVEPEAPPVAVAVRCAVPATVELSDEVAMPLVVVPEGGGLPMSEANVTLVPFATRLLY